LPLGLHLLFDLFGYFVNAWANAIGLRSRGFLLVATSACGVAVTSPLARPVSIRCAYVSLAKTLNLHYSFSPGPEAETLSPGTPPPFGILCIDPHPSSTLPASIRIASMFAGMRG
jgi:hypothetical protein